MSRVDSVALVAKARINLFPHLPLSLSLPLKPQLRHPLFFSPFAMG